MALALSAVLAAQAYAQASETASLDGAWQFALAPTEKAADALRDFYRPEYKAAAFRATPVPSNWALQGYEPPHYKPWTGEASQGFYLKHFPTPAGFESKRVLLHFGGVWSSAEVWLNGEPLGRHDSGFTSFAYDVGSLLKAGADNVLAVRVRQVQHDYLFDTNDDWSLGGIYRSVTLEAMPKELYIDRADVQTSFDSQFRDADLRVRVMVGDQHPRHLPGNLPDEQGGPYQLQFTLLDAAGHEVQTQGRTVPLHRGTARETSVTMHVLQPLQWTAETPNLYTLRVTLLENGKPVHERVRSVGFRQISTAGGVFRVNGQAIKLRGVDRHDEYPDVGRATTPANWLQDVQMMKAANINFVRNSHYPPAEGFLDLCDRMGLYVEDEVPMGFGGDHAADPSFASAVMLRSYETVERDLNHPAIVMWSIGNEDPLTSLHMASVRTVKGLDPTRPVLMPWRAEEWLPEEIDLLAPHYFTAEQFDQLAAHATRPIVSSEYTHAYGTDGFGGLHERWKALTRHPAGAGGAIWMWADQGLSVPEKKPDGSMGRRLIEVDDGIDGIVGSHREPQRDYWETKAVYAPVFPSVDKVAFTPGQPSVRVPIQNDFDFLDLRTVKVQWSVREDAKELASGTATLAGKAHATAWLDLPVASIETIRPGATYYASLTFLREDGSEITRRSVELASTGGAVADVLMTPHRPVVQPVAQQGGHVVVQVGEASFDFDPHTGQLASASSKGAKQISNLRPTLWHDLQSTELNLTRKDTGMETPPDLNRFNATAREWHVTEADDGVRIHAVVEYAVDDRNSFAGTFDYTITADGRLRVHYSLLPKVQAHWLRQVGLRLDLAPALTQVEWLGLGPLDAYPNERTAPILGVWGGAAGSDAVAGNKATRWISLHDLHEPGDARGAHDPKRGVRIENDGYLWSEAKTPRQLDVLSAVVGRTSKGRRPEAPEQQLNTGDGKAFVGELSLTLQP